jgi:hypothetical protein
MAATENSAVNRIIDSELVVQHFGYWPSFHDATLERISFKIQSSQNRINFLIATAEFTNELDEQGRYKEFRPCHIELQFDSVRDASLIFDHVPVLFEVAFEEASDAINCSFSSSAGSYTIISEQITVLGLTPTVQ